MPFLLFPFNHYSVLSLWSLHFSFCFLPLRRISSPLYSFTHFTTTSSQSFFLSLHRDVRRLVVAMSRARLGLYIFARVSLFQNCFELTPAFNQLTARPLQLHIRPHEYYNQEQPVSSHTHAHADLIKPTILDLPHYEIFNWEICW